MNSWSSYPSIYNLGHNAVADLFSEPVVIQEKIDGNQFSFGLFDDGIVRCRSKGAQINIDNPEGMFKMAVEKVLSIKSRLVPGWTYRGEYLEKPKHNTLKYNRIPNSHIILFDINDVQEGYLPHSVVSDRAVKLGLEVVPQFFSGMWTGDDKDLLRLLEIESCLGGPTIEGVVVKSLSLYGPDKKRLMGKFVSEAFKESHKTSWKISNPGGKDIIELIADKYKTEARWRKAVQHLREAGLITNSPADIGPLMKELNVDLLKECSDEIKEMLFKWAIGNINRKTTRGFPEWYKEQLLEKQFDTD